MNNPFAYLNEFHKYKNRAESANDLNSEDNADILSASASPSTSLRSQNLELEQRL